MLWCSPALRSFWMAAELAEAQVALVVALLPKGSLPMLIWT